MQLTRSFRFGSACYSRGNFFDCLASQAERSPDAECGANTGSDSPNARTDGGGAYHPFHGRSAIDLVEGHLFDGTGDGSNEGTLSSLT